MNDFEGLEKKVLIKGHCGHYHTEDECEVVVVKIVKGKKCPLGDAVSTITADTHSTIENQTVTRKEITQDDQINDAPAPIKKNILPPAILSMMYPPGDPRHETQGAKERRAV